MSRDHELVTIAFSHFCEKARWALDVIGVPYREQGYLPGFHLAAVALRTRGQGGRPDAASSRFSTPLLVTDRGLRLTDSSEILAWADSEHGTGALHAHPEAKRIEHELGLRLGPHTRRVGYYHMLPDRPLLREMARRNVSLGQQLAFRALEGGATKLIATQLRVDEAHAERSLDRVRTVADEVGARIADGRPYLLGDAFGAADLTFAALMAPVVLPPEYGAAFPTLDELREPTRALVEEMRAHPAGAFALRLYRERRHRALA